MASKGLILVKAPNLTGHHNILREYVYDLMDCTEDVEPEIEAKPNKKKL